MTETGDIVRQLAEDHGILASDDYATFMAKEFNRIEGVEGDDTLDLIAALSRAGKISKAYAQQLVVKHTIELSEDIANQGDTHGRKTMGPVR